ncbi:uncharacterized protein LAESUDRAFT_244624 [Laetiporus sulphureus 93-53]|uniref:Uncharacterized protein n=1 Tax=Laetiporus sulphureus 93-53 TaxID=1314785 RepID=A0A165DH05_9APHY|nr:uncharacterized protein LAESUDRAFT_244624 [Laetiporus sulphureus 93-53]KZT04858.1 hypothetical protein LAESUDRAFT_244624 [Laetiporus sulphureus 93-53]
MTSGASQEPQLAFINELAPVCTEEAQPRHIALILLHVHSHLNCLLLTLVRPFSGRGPFEKLVGAVRGKAPSECSTLAMVMACARMKHPYNRIPHRDPYCVPSSLSSIRPVFKFAQSMQVSPFSDLLSLALVWPKECCNCQMHGTGSIAC